MMIVLSFLAIVLLTQQQSNRIKIVPQSSKNLLNNNFPEVYPYPRWKTKPEPTVIDKKTISFNLCNLYQYFRAWAKLIPNKQSDPILIDFSTIYLETESCKLKNYLYSETLTQIININSNPDYLNPGSLISSIYQRISDGVTPIFVSSQKRNPYNVIVTLNNGLTTSINKISNPNDLSTKLKNILSTNTFLHEIKIDIKSSRQIYDFLSGLGLSYKMLEQVRAASESSDFWKKNKYQKRTYIVLFQKYFSAAVDFTRSYETTLTEFIFNQNFTSNDFSLYLQANIWGMEKPPAFITQTNYGKLLVMSVEETATNLEHLSNLKKLLPLNTESKDMVVFSQSLKKLQESRNTMVTSKGFLPKPVLKSMNIMDLFLNQNYASAQTYLLEPISFNLVNLMGDKITQTQNRYFSEPECNSKRRIIVRFSSVSNSASLFVKYQGNFVFVQTFNRGGGSVDITNFVEGITEVRVDVTGRRNWFISNFNSEAKVHFYSNGREIFWKIVGAKRSKRSSRSFYFRIDTIVDTVYA